jgi:16S rRNA (guanine527-N7)-methyltransferase
MTRQENLTSLSVSRETTAQLNEFVALVKKWNPVINLIAKGSISNIWSRHIEDSAQIIALAKLSDYWIDIGSGGGFPGIVVAICLKEISPPPALYWLKVICERPLSFGKLQLL